MHGLKNQIVILFKEFPVSRRSFEFRLPMGKRGKLREENNKALFRVMKGASETVVECIS